MEKLLKVFNYESIEIKTMVIEGEPWFLAKDVCRVLEHSDTSTALRRLDDDEKLTQTLFVSGQNRKAWFINESGLYELILTSRKPQAKPFKRWVKAEVLPSIRKTGGYVADDNLFVESYFSALDDTQKALLKGVLENTRKLKEENETMKPKSEYFDRLVDRNLLTNFRDTAKQLGIKESELIDFLLEKKYVFRNDKKQLRPYAQHTPTLFKLKDWERYGKTGQQTLITPRGKETFRLLLENAGYLLSEGQEDGTA